MMNTELLETCKELE